MKARDYIPALRFGAKIYPEDLAVGNPWANFWYVDEDNGSDSANNGASADKPVASLEQAISNAGRGDVIFVRAQKVATGATDPESYTENAVIPADKDGLSIIGVDTGRTQGGLPQLKVGATTTQAILTVRAPNCYIANLGFNGSGATGGGILLDDDGSTKTAFGTTIENCHFKNCVGTTATNAATGGAIQLSGAPWQILIRGNNFYKNVGDVVLKDTSNSVPQDLVIEENIFMGTAAAVDCHLYLAGGSGSSSVAVRRNTFAAVLPALASGSIVRYADLTGCTGDFSNNTFAGSYTTTGFGVAKAAAKIPTAVGLAHNYTDGGLIVREA